MKHGRLGVPAAGQNNRHIQADAEAAEGDPLAINSRLLNEVNIKLSPLIAVLGNGNGK